MEEASINIRSGRKKAKLIKFYPQSKVQKNLIKMSTNPWRSLYKDYCDQSSTSNHCYLFDYFADKYDTKLTNAEKFDIFNWRTFSKLFESSEKINYKEIYSCDRVWYIFKSLENIEKGDKIFNKVVKVIIDEQSKIDPWKLPPKNDFYKGKPPKTKIEVPEIISKLKSNTLNKMWKCNIIMPFQDIDGLIDTAISREYPYEYLYDYLKCTETMPLNDSKGVKIERNSEYERKRRYEFYIPYLSVVRNLHPSGLDPKEVAEIVSLFYLKRKELTGNLMEDVNKHRCAKYKNNGKVISDYRPYFGHDYSAGTYSENMAGFDLDDYYPEISKVHPELNYSWYEMFLSGPMG